MPTSPTPGFTRLSSRSPATKVSPSWRALKLHVDRTSPAFGDRDRVFAAARIGDVEAVRRAFASGFDPATPDPDGRTVYQIAKDCRHGVIELLARDLQGGKTRPDDEMQAIQAILRAAQSGDLEALGAGLDAHPEWLNALGGGFQKATALHLAVLRNQHAATRLLIARGADLNRREFPDNAAPLHFAAVHGDLETIRLLVEAGADIEGRGDDHGVGVLGWATCFDKVRQDVAAYLLDHGATLNVWTAIALDRPDALHDLVSRDNALLGARMSRNQHRRTPLHHAVAKNRPRMVRLLLELGADSDARDATGASALATASQSGTDKSIVAALLESGAAVDFLAAIISGTIARPRRCCGTTLRGSDLTAGTPLRCISRSPGRTCRPFAGCWPTASTSMRSDRCGIATIRRCT